MDQYLLIQFLGGWASIYQLFWCSPGVQGFDTLPCQFYCRIFEGIQVPKMTASQAESEEKMVEIVSETMVTLGRLENRQRWINSAEF